jgi:ankyrin repeat protein
VANTRTLLVRFLLPALQIREILDQLTKSDVRRALGNLSADISEAFQSTLDRIKGQSGSRRNLALRTLMFISHAKRNLTIDELRHALAVRMEEDDLDRDNIPSVKAILDSCHGLVEVAEISKLRFVHFTLEEYLRTDHGLFENGNLEITKVCLRYMALESLKTLPWMNRNDFDKAMTDFPFLDYSSFEFGYHAREVSVDQVRDLALSFFNSKLHLLTVARVRDSKSPDLRKWKEKMTQWAFSGGAAISLASSFGMTNFIKLLFEQTEERVWARNVYGSTALHEACMKGYEDTAKLLIANGADLLDSNAGKNTPLYLAVAYNRISMARTLLSYGQEQVNVVCRGGWTALINAADLANEEMVMLLLEAGADHSIRNDRGMTALHMASRTNNVEVAKLLLLAGAPVDTQNADGLTPLALATTGGHLEVTTLLLDNHADLNCVGRDKWTPLHRAARGARTDTVALLIARGANIMVRDGKGNLPLHLAARSGHIETVKLVLNSHDDMKRSQLFAKDRSGSTARMVAFYTAHYDIHKLLRAAEMEILGVDEVVSADKLTAAIEDGQYSKVRHLLETGETQIDQPDENGQAPLHTAIQEERLDIAELLVEFGAAIESVGYHHWRPLHVAASIGSVPLVNMCLRHGADIHARTSTEQTPLHKACSSKSVDVVRILLEAGADPEARNHRGMRAIHIACHNNHRDIVRLLVREWHVDLSARDNFGDTAADWCDRAGHLDLLRFMREEEKQRGKGGRTASGGVVRSMEYGALEASSGGPFDYPITS